MTWQAISVWPWLLVASDQKVVLPTNGGASPINAAFASDFGGGVVRRRKVGRRGFRSSTFRLNVSTFYGTRGVVSVRFGDKNGSICAEKWTSISP